MKYPGVFWLSFKQFIQDLDRVNPSVDFINTQYVQAWDKGVKAAAWILPDIAHYAPARERYWYILDFIAEAANGYPWKETGKAKASKTQLQSRQVVAKEFGLVQAVAKGDFKKAKQKAIKIVRRLAGYQETELRTLFDHDDSEKTPQTSTAMNVDDLPEQVLDLSVSWYLGST